MILYDQRLGPAEYITHQINYVALCVFITCRSLWVINSLIQRRRAHLASLSTFIPNYNLLGRRPMQRSLEEAVNINTNIIPGISNAAVLVQLPDSADLSRLLHTSSSLPPKYPCSLNTSPPPPSLARSLSHCRSGSLSPGRDVMSLIAAR